MREVFTKAQVRQMLKDFGFTEEVIAKSMKSAIPMSEDEVAAGLIPDFDEPVVDIVALAKKFNTLCAEKNTTTQAKHRLEKELRITAACAEQADALLKTFCIEHKQYLKQIKEASLVEHFVDGFDPYPELAPEDVCKCGSGRMYKNCHGRKAFCNPKTGKIVRAKPGYIRVSEYKASR